MPAHCSDYYKALGVDPRASHEVIEAAYHALLKLHEFEGKTRVRTAIDEAAEVLLDRAKRSAYDKEREKPLGKKVIGSYRILEKIAEGGFGVTYKAEHTTLGSLVCLKHASHISAEDEELLFGEARAMWDLRHFSIPAVRDVVRMPDKSVALVMSYVPGLTLEQIIRKNYPDGIDPEHVAWITERILNVLKYLHYHGVVHGDVKPQNVIIQNDDHTVVLVDYGLSAIKPSRSDTTKGYTPLFAAPEQIEGKALVPETDLYGLGMTMIYALGGDIEHVKVPGTTPKHLCQLIKDFIRRDVLSRPNWQKEDLCDRIARVREGDFGRRSSGMKPLKVT